MSARFIPWLFGLLLSSWLAPEIACASDGLIVPLFEDVTAQSGIASIYKGDWQYMVGGGTAAFDCNGDQFPDVALAGGEGTAALFINKSKLGGPLQFEPVTSGIELTGVTGIYPIDIDGDGMTDLVLLRVGEVVLMRGLGQCRFERANETWHFNGDKAWWTSFSATWEKGSKWPTLAFGAYINPQSEDNPWGSCTDNQLFRPNHDGNGFAEPIALKPSYCALSMLFTDWNRSGTPSLRVSNDREYYEGGQEQLWHVEPGKAPRLYTEPEGWKFLKIWGMGIASTVFPNETYPSYFLTSMSDNKLQILTGAQPDAGPAPLYKDLAYDRGAIAYRPYTGGDLKPSTAWHAQFEDVNNDGYFDLFVAKGNVDQMPDFAAKDPSNLMMQRPDGHFEEVGDVAGIVRFASARGAALADFNLDGKMDLIVVNRRENATLWQNVTPQIGNFVDVRLHQDDGNTEAIGAWIEVDDGNHISRREITIGGGHAGGQLGWHHFGVGQAREIKIRTIWPDGKADDWASYASNAHYILSRGQPLKPWPSN
jgi:hypothetical protein